MTRAAGGWWARIRPQTFLSPLTTAGHVFRLADGTPFTAIEASDFHLYGRYLNGEDIAPVLDQRATFGFNLLRVWTLYDLERWGIGRLLLSDHPDLYEGLPAFCQQLARMDLYVEFTAYTSTWAPDHWSRLTSALQGTTNAIVELVNEYNEPANEIPMERFAPVAGLLCSHGSGGSQVTPPRPAWDYETFHTNDAPEWWRKVGHNAMELSDGADGLVGSGVPILTNENTRFPDRDASYAHAFDAAAGAALLCAGSCFHSVSGKASVLWTGQERVCAAAWADGARAVPLRFQGGRYRHAQERETAQILRAYQRVLPSGEAYTVAIRT